MIPKWPIENHDKFIEWVVTHRGKGWTWDKVATALKIGRSTLYEFFDKFPDVRTKIDALTDTQQIENLRQTGMELAIEKKDRQLLIYLMKAKAKMFDTPQPEKPKEEDLVQALTPEEALAKLEKMRNGL